MARALKFGLSVSWPILATMFGQTWVASRWVNQMENSDIMVRKEMEEIRAQNAEIRAQNELRLSRVENVLFFKQEK